jgi:hypothetical protein
VEARGPAFVWGIIAFVVGLLPAFWLAGPALFFPSAIGAGLGRVTLCAGVILLCGVGAGALAPRKHTAIFIGLGLTTVPVLVLADWNAAATLQLAAAFVVGTAVCAWAGTMIGAGITRAVVARRSGR